MLFPGCDAPRKRPRRGAHSGAGRMRFIRCRGSGGCRQSPSAGRRRRGCSRSSCRRGTVGSSKRNSTRKLTFLGAISWWARVDYASRASKKAPQGLFSPAGLFDGSMLFESTRLASGKVITKQKLQYPVRILEFLVGAGGFEPPKLKSSRFTVCPHWPLGNTPIFYLQSSLTACIFYHLKWHLSTTFSTDFLFFCRSLFSCVLPQ